MSNAAYARRLLSCRTKVVATVGPACRREEQLAELVEAGVDVFRLNAAHGELAEHDICLKSIRRVSQRAGRPVAVLVDLAGPKIRLGELPGGAVDCPLGGTFRFVRGETATAHGELTASYSLLVDELEVGDRVMLADGTVGLTVAERGADYASCRVTQPGRIRSRQGVNLPGVKLSLPSMDDDDREAARWAASAGADFVSLSFVRTAADVVGLKALLRDCRSTARVIAKIEKPEALTNLEAIVAEADGVMVARGDLGVEIDVAEMPVAQKRIIATCSAWQKPVIIATQMLDSMQHSLQPTRAEVTDVANAILDGGDACMLSGETAIGEHPRAAVEMIVRIAHATEELLRDRPPHASARRAEGLHEITQAVVNGASHISRQLAARLMVVWSQGGPTALAVAKQRLGVPTMGASGSPEALRRMCLYWGISPLPEAIDDDNAGLMTMIDHWGRRDGYLHGGDRVVYVRGTNDQPPVHNMLVVYELE